MALLLNYGMIPTRADRCCYVYYRPTSTAQKSKSPPIPKGMNSLEAAIDYLTDPISGSPSEGQAVCGVILLHVDDLFMAGNTHFMDNVYKPLVNDFQVGSEDTNNVEFVGQRIKWIPATDKVKAHISVDQNKNIDGLIDVEFQHDLKDDIDGWVQKQLIPAFDEDATLEKYEGRWQEQTREEQGSERARSTASQPVAEESQPGGR